MVQIFAETYFRGLIFAETNFPFGECELHAQTQENTQVQHQAFDIRYVIMKVIINE